MTVGELISKLQEFGSTEEVFLKRGTGYSSKWGADFIYDQIEGVERRIKPSDHIKTMVVVRAI